MSGITIKTDEEIESMRRGGKILAETLEEVIKHAKPGVSTKYLDEVAEGYITSKGGKPGFKGYSGFPATLCTCRNNKIVHGIPNETEILENGDLLTIDCGVILDGLNTDAARTVGIGEISKERERLIRTAYEALSTAIDIVKPGIHVGEIGRTIENIVKREGFYIIHDLTGHGIGKKLHEPPHILNYWDGTPGPRLKEGMTIAIEPIFSAGSSKMKTLGDNWTIVTLDGSDAVQAENTILVTKNGHEVITTTQN